MKFNAPEIEVVKFAVADIITTSTDPTESTWGGYDNETEEF